VLPLHHEHHQSRPAFESGRSGRGGSRTRKAERSPAFQTGPVANRVALPARNRQTDQWSRVDSNHRFSPRQRDVFAARRRDLDRTRQCLALGAGLQTPPSAGPIGLTPAPGSETCRSVRWQGQETLPERVHCRWEYRKVISVPFLDDGTSITLDNAPARTRTRNTSLEARHDHPFHHQGA
jgi:hypothetical protein